jgi:lipoate---protein ligase
MKLYNLGKIPWEESQLIYHALGYLGHEALSLVSPASPYVCIGYNQDAEQEVDLGYCEENNIPVFRREVGGGAVYLDGNQLFYQVILRMDNPAVTKNKGLFYKKMLQPVINVYRHIGIEAEYKPINDVIVETRKISGTGAAEIGNCIVFVGNLIVDFDYKTMSRVLRVPDEKFRDKVHKTLRDNLSTIRRELGEEKASPWDETTLNNLMAKEFEKILGPLSASDMDKELEQKMDDLRARMMNDAWLFQKGKKRTKGRDIKIRQGTNLTHKVHKAPGGLIRADIEVIEGKLGSVSLSGDFFCYPAEAIDWLESGLNGIHFDDVGTFLDSFYKEKGIETPGITIKDWLKVLTD